MTLSRAAQRLWANLCLVVIDLETAVGPDGHRVISIAVVTCRAGTKRGQWQQLVDPGIPIDRRTHEVHHVADADLVGEPAFGEVASHVLALLEPRDDETLVLCAHNTRFDVPVLRAEMERLGRSLPVVPLLDTAGRLPRLAGVRPASRKLQDLVAALGITNATPHEALADAAATALAACALLDLAAGAGYDDLAALLIELDEGTSGSVGFASPGSPKPRPEAPPLPDAHIASHTEALGPTPSQRRLGAWEKALAECARLRCGLLEDEVRTADARPEVLGLVLRRALLAKAGAGDAVGAATLLGGLLPLLGASGLGSPAVRRRAAIDLHAELSAALDPLPRCPTADPCPSCRAGAGCPLDVWRLALAPAALGGPVETMARGFLETTGREAGRGPYVEMARKGHGRLADAALRLVHQHWRDAGQPTRADQLAQLAWDAGCRDAAIAEGLAVALAAGGREADLEAGLAVCDEALTVRSGNTDEAWGSLGIRKASIDGRLQRRRVRYGTEVDESGRLKSIRSHLPTKPHRMRQPRFLREPIAPLDPAA